jgi:hypothetical protein
MGDLSFPNIYHTEKSLILPPRGSRLVSTIRLKMRACDMQSAKLSQESTCMEPRSSSWMTELVEAVAGCMEAYSAMGAMGGRYHEDDERAELVVYATPVELVGGEHDGAIVMPGFSLDVQALQGVFEHVTELHWHAQGFGPDDDDGPHISIEGTYQGHHVWLRVLAAAPEDEEPGLQLDTSASP